MPGSAGSPEETLKRAIVAIPTPEDGPFLRKKMDRPEKTATSAYSVRLR